MAISINDTSALYICSGSTTAGMVTSLPKARDLDVPAEMEITINLEYVRCRNCSRMPLACGTYTCPSCARGTGSHNLRLRPPSSLIEINHSASEKVMEEFGGELSTDESLEQWHMG
jgi:hypothetical protein